MLRPDCLPPGYSRRADLLDPSRDAPPGFRPLNISFETPRGISPDLCLSCERAGLDICGVSLAFLLSTFRRVGLRVPLYQPPSRLPACARGGAVLSQNLGQALDVELLRTNAFLPSLAYGHSGPRRDN